MKNFPFYTNYSFKTNITLKGLENLFLNTLIPHKNTKNTKLNQFNKLVNQIISSIRVQ